MARDLDYLLPDVAMKPPYPAEDVDEFLADFVAGVGEIPHEEYLSFMRRHDGADGPVGQLNSLARVSAYLSPSAAGAPTGGLRFNHDSAGEGTGGT